MAREVARWRERGLKVGFTNGCFDILHRGHVAYLAQARAWCDRLIVGLNTDRSVRALKGEGRPVNDLESRALVLAGLRSVDLVVPFDEDTPMRPDRGGAARRADQGRRLQPRGRRRPRPGGELGRRGAARRLRRGPFHHRDHQQAGQARMTRKIAFVTGGAGFIGSNIVARLAEDWDLDVVVCDWLRRGRRRQVAQHRQAPDRRFLSRPSRCSTGWPSAGRRSRW